MESDLAPPADATKLPLFPAYAGHPGYYPHHGAFNGNLGEYGPYFNLLTYNGHLGAVVPSVNHPTYNDHLGAVQPGVNHISYNDHLGAYGPYNNLIKHNGYGQRYLANPYFAGYSSYPNFPIDPSMASDKT